MLKNIVLSRRYHCVWLKLAFCRQLLTKHIVNLNVWPFFEKVDMKIAILFNLYISAQTVIINHYRWLQVKNFLIFKFRKHAQGMGLEWHYFLCIGSVFPFLCGTFSVILVILKYTGTGLLSPTVSLCPNGITRYSVFLTLFYILSYMQILTKLTAMSIAVSACQQSNSHVQACVIGCRFVTARIVKFFGGEEHSPHPPYPLHICFLSLIPQCMW